MAYTYTKNGNLYDIFNNGTKVTTGSGSILANYGLSDSSFTPTTGFQDTQTAGGISYGSITPPNTITADSLRQTTPLPPLPPVQNDTTNYSGITAGAQVYTTPSRAKVDAQGNPISTPTPTTPTPYTDQSKGLLSTIQGLLGKTTDKTAFEQAQLEASGALELEKKQAQLTAQANALVAESLGLKNQAMPGGAIENRLQLESVGRGRTEGGLAPLTADELRKNQIQQADLASRALTVQSAYALNAGDLETARASAQRAVDLKYKPIENEIDQKLKLLQLYTPFMNEEQQQIADQRTREYEAQKTALADRKKLQQDVVNSFQQSGQGNLVSQTLQLNPEDPQFPQKLANLASQLQMPQKSLSGGIGIGGQTTMSPISKSVISNPSLFYNFTPTQKAQIVSELQANGYDISGLQNAKLSAGQQDEVAQMSTVSNLINQVLAFNSDGLLDGIGAFGLGTLKSLGAQVGIGSEEGQAVRALIGNIKGTIAKLRGGTSFTPNEEKLLDSYTPSINDSSAVAVNKLHLLQDFIAQKNADLLKVAGTNITTGQITKPGTTSDILDIKNQYNLNY